MLIGISGSACSGKTTLAHWLRDTHGFHILRLRADEEADGNDGNMDFTASELDTHILADERWRANYVILPVENAHQLKVLGKRPYFLHLKIDAPTLVRYQRYCTSQSRKQNGYSQLSLEGFLQRTEENAADIIGTHTADSFIFNPYKTLEEFCSCCAEWYQSGLADKSSLRPSWDDYFMLLADLASHRSNCMKRRVGCIIVKNRRVVATGYNGTPKGAVNCCDGGCRRCNSGAKCGEGLAECMCLHAEENALLEAGRERLQSDPYSDGPGVVLYCNTCPCVSCAKKIVQCGIPEVVYRQKYGIDSASASLFAQTGVLLRQHRPAFKLHLTDNSYQAISNGLPPPSDR